MLESFAKLAVFQKALKESGFLEGGKIVSFKKSISAKGKK